MDFKVVLEIVGICTILGIVFLFGIMLYEIIADKLRDLKWQYKYKHRFDKPPTAKCYCKDCKYYKVEDGYFNRCTRGHIAHWTIADNDFCWQAEPLKKDPDLRNDKYV